jgi:hypothetical protein
MYPTVPYRLKFSAGRMHEPRREVCGLPSSQVGDAAAAVVQHRSSAVQCSTVAVTAAVQHRSSAVQHRSSTECNRVAASFQEDVVGLPLPVVQAGTGCGQRQSRLIELWC